MIIFNAYFAENVSILCNANVYKMYNICTCMCVFLRSKYFYE